MEKLGNPKNESNRIQALCKLEILDTPAEARFDRITRVAQRHFSVSIALVSLVDTDRQWFKSRQGLDASETPRDISFCGHAILGNNILYIPNALEDPRFVDNPLVTGPPNIRFYAGAPLRAPGGEHVGTLCIIDDKPREFTTEEFSVLRDLADCVEAELERANLQKVEQDLRIGEARLKAIVDTVLDSIITINSQGIVQTYNPAAESTFGYTAEEVIGRNVKMLMPAPYSVEHDDYLHNYLTTGEKKIIGIGREVIGKRKDGSTFSMELAVNATDVNEQLMFTGVVRDITLRKQAELKNNELIDRLHLATQSAQLGIWDWDIVNNILVWDELMFSLYGVKESDFGGAYEAWIAGLHPNDSEYANKAVQLAVEGKRIYDIEFRVIWPNGEIRHIKAEGTVLRDSANKPVRMLGTNYDITNRKTMELAAKRFEAIVQFSDDAIISKTLEGVITSWNTGAEKIFGYNASEAIGQPMLMLFPDDRKYEEAEILAKIAHGENVDHFETTRLRKDGTLVELSVSLSPIIDETGKVIGASKIARDISERKKVERLKNEFISTVSHELRTPLTSIRGAIGLVLGKFSGGLHEKAHKMLEMAERNSLRLTLLINDLLDLEKIESGKLEFELESVNLTTIVKNAIEANEGYACQHQITLLLDNSIEDAMVWADENRLMQVFANLISNAVKFSHQDGVINVRLTKENRKYRVSIEDHGRGIPEEFRKRIFSRFAQADSSDTREKGGTGLGLSITKAIVDRIGGVIGYDTEIDHGTTFWFELPVWQEVTMHSPDDESKKRAIICEDNPDVAEILSRLLEQQGLHCDIAATAAAAKRLLLKYHYAVLLLDLALPDACGLDLLSELRENEKTKSLPVIVVSGQAKEGQHDFVGDVVTVVDWVQKPVDKNRLEHALNLALDKTERPNILHVEDDKDVIQIVENLVSNIADYEYVFTCAQARQKLLNNKYDLVILDLSLPDGSGLELIDSIKDQCPVVIFSGTEPALEVSKQVTAALTKSTTNNEQLLATINRAIVQGNAIS